jgi:hypothetical protein
MQLLLPSPAIANSVPDEETKAGAGSANYSVMFRQTLVCRHALPQAVWQQKLRTTAFLNSCRQGAEYSSLVNFSAQKQSVALPPRQDVRTIWRRDRAAGPSTARRKNRRITYPA